MPSPTGIRPQRIVVTCADANTPEALSDTTIPCTGIIFYGAKGTGDVANTGTVYIQLKDSAGDWANAFPVTSGGWSPSLFPSDGTSIPLTNIRVKATQNGDGVIAILL